MPPREKEPNSVDAGLEMVSLEQLVRSDTD